MHHWNSKYPARFELDSNHDYQQWRDEKLAAYPRQLADLVVELGDMTAITAAEKAKIMQLVERANMCVYSAGAADIGMDSLLKLGAQLGISQTDKSTRHTNSDELTASGILNKAIPFTTRPARWHTDATYYGSDKTIQALFLLCKRPALTGGSNKVLDHEMLYILLRDKAPEALKVLMRNDCFKYKNPKTGEISEQLGGKVFWTNPDGYLNHRFSFRKMDMAWSEESDVLAARDILESLLLEESEFVIEGRLEPGLGLISNNVVHTREKLVDSEDDASKRLLYRARFYDRVNAG
ncbi:MAG: TauD/TfdA family dioxygenase [Gammaproteobacteria bacterium]|nr:TauD/TfdA family dioxygenase [Gammaproteobacteria bacterium]MBL6999326.1 TauD/TfdA family dioxygenase [Gammaproteobacteria bacterium]